MRDLLKKSALAFGIVTASIGSANAQNLTEQAVIDQSYQNILEIAQDPDMQQYVTTGYNLLSDTDYKRYLYAMNQAKNNVYGDNITEKMQMSFCLAANTVSYMGLLLPQIKNQEARIKMQGIRNLAANTALAMDTYVYEGAANRRNCPQIYTTHGIPAARNLP